MAANERPQRPQRPHTVLRFRHIQVIARDYLDSCRIEQSSIASTRCGYLLEPK